MRGRRQGLAAVVVAVATLAAGYGEAVQATQAGASAPQAERPTLEGGYSLTFTNPKVGEWDDIYRGKEGNLLVFEDVYHGKFFKWYATEDLALRAFINSRVVDGDQRITEMLSIHSAGSTVLWPYGYTTVNVPSTMTADDHKAFVALGKGMGRRNGYLPQQSSDLYITDGDSNDWAYRNQGIFALTLELAKGSDMRYYPSLSELTTDLGRNRSAVLWFLEQADCPYRAAGLAGQYCSTTASAADVERAVRWRSAKRSD